MTVVARKDSGRSLLTMPSNKGVRCMSYEDTLREMEAYLDGKIDKNPHHHQPNQPQVKVEEVEGQGQANIEGEAQGGGVVVQEEEEVYVDVTDELISSSRIKVPHSDDDDDATEYSSSFGDTVSRDDNVSAPSDEEVVESEFHHAHHDDSGLTSMLNGYVNNVYPLRKRRLTNHWRSFIRPLMWRCKWTELRIKELESQALKYAHELETDDQTKTLELQKYTSDVCSKSFSYYNHSTKRKPMKRRKRKLVETVTDISSYVSRHHLFSYLENKKFDLDGTLTVDDIGNLDLCSKNDEFCMDDNWLRDGEDSVEQILRQIETVQSQVQKLRNHLEMAMLKNGVKLSSSENLCLLAPYDAQTSAAQSPAFSAGNGDTMSIGAMYVPSQHLTDFEIGDLDLPDSISGYGEGTQIPDIIESTVGLLSAADVTSHHPQITESGENILDEAIVIQNQNVQDGHLSSRVFDKTIVPKKEEQNISKPPANNTLVADPVTTDTMVVEKSALETCLTSDIQIPKNKRKRGERKAGPGGWNL